MSEFESALAAIRLQSPSFHAALVDVNDSVEQAKKILLNNRVQNFNAADVVALTKIIIEREQRESDAIRQAEADC